MCARHTCPKSTTRSKGLPNTCKRSVFCTFLCHHTKKTQQTQGDTNWKIFPYHGHFNYCVYCWLFRDIDHIAHVSSQTLLIFLVRAVQDLLGRDGASEVAAGHPSRAHENCIQHAVQWGLRGECPTIVGLVCIRRHPGRFRLRVGVDVDGATTMRSTQACIHTCIHPSTCIHRWCWDKNIFRRSGYCTLD